MARERQADARTGPALRLLLGRQGEATATPSRSSSRTTTSRATSTTSTTPTRTTSRRGCRRPTRSTRRRSSAPASASSTVPGSSKTASSRSRTRSSAAAWARPTSRTTGSRIRCRRDQLRNTLSIRGYTHQPARRVQHAVRRQRVARAARRGQPDRRLHRQPRQGHVPARRRQHPAAGDAHAADAERTGRWTTRRRVASTGWSSTASRSAGAAAPATTRCRSACRGASAPASPAACSTRYSRNKGTTQGSNEAATTQNTFDYETEYGTNPQDIPHTFNGSLVYQLPGEGFWTGGWRVGGIVNARSGVPINVTINRPDNITVNGATVREHPRRQQPRHAAARPGAWRRPLPEGRRAVAEPGGVCDAAAGHLRQPAAQLPARAELLAGRPDVQQGLPVHADAGRPGARSRSSTSPTG